MYIVMTAFEPFGGDSLNASWEALKLLTPPPGIEMKKILLPTEFGRAGKLLLNEVSNSLPDSVICLGEAGGRQAITPERIAINLRDARIADNAGFQPVDESVVSGAPAAYFSNLPIKAMVNACRASGVPAELSNTAGTYVCNDLMFSLLHFIYQVQPGIQGGFIHIPAILAGEKSRKDELSLEAIAKGLSAMLQVLAENE